MFLSCTEDDGLLVMIILIYELLYTMLVALLNLYSTIVEIRLCIYLFRVYFSSFNCITSFKLIIVYIAGGNVNSEWNKETILDTLFKRIGINWLSKICLCVGIIFSSWCSRHTEVVSRIKILH